VDNISPLGFWEASMAAITVGGTDLDLLNRSAILDTGTTTIIAPPADAVALHQAIPGAQSDQQGGFTIPCNTTTVVALSFGSTSFSIDPRDLSLGPVDPTNPAGDCVSGVMAGSVGTPTQWLVRFQLAVSVTLVLMISAQVGDVFLKNAYLSTNVNTNQISLAKLT
jgi:Eukaryotic aspartyl protease